MVFSDQIQDVQKQEVFNQTFDWLLNQYTVANPAKQLSCKKWKLLKSSLSSILIQCLPRPEIYYVHKSEADWMKGLDIALACMLKKI